ncbi:hypothetical protein IGI39_004137 [Enterococcus sp. AZ135]|uniref:alpha/beta hydrolase n=1 Tax=unclassified Enterococcus TaxID=2608891 RepID=UPI003F228F49
MKIILTMVLGLILLLTLIIVIGRSINAKKYKIYTKTGVQKTEYVTLGGIKQYIQIRGEDAANPIVLVLHGGPGSNMSYYSYDWQSAFEQDYTIVHWDQRGCGNTFYCNREGAKPTVDVLLSDVDELVDHLRLTYNKEKIIILGHSWGTFLGGIYAGKHPEKVSAYVGVSQMLDFKQSEKVSAEEAIRFAKQISRNKDAAKIEEQLEGILSYRRIDRKCAADFLKFRQLKGKYLPNGEELSMRHTMWNIFSSPYMTSNDLKWLFNFKQLIESNTELYKELLSEKNLSMYDFSMDYEIPTFIVAGDCDWITPFSMALDYFNDISAPQKKFISIEKAGHSPFMDKPAIFSKELLEVLDTVEK